MRVYGAFWAIWNVTDHKFRCPQGRQTPLLFNSKHAAREFADRNCGAKWRPVKVDLVGPDDRLDMPAGI